MENDDLGNLTRVVATFQPARTDDLQNGAADWIGWRGLWDAMFVIERAPYEGQWAMMPQGDIGNRPQFAWAPFCDLANVAETSGPIVTAAHQ